MENKIIKRDLKTPNSCDDDILEGNSRRSDIKIDDMKISIIEHTDDYIIMNKPWDVRMYGDFSLTVEKLLSRWTGIAGNFKWVHRLDYATSGVLCVGKNTKFAAAASRAFERRMVRKNYLAVVQGIVVPTIYPILSHLSLNTMSSSSKNNNNDNNNRDSKDSNDNNNSPIAPHKRKREGVENESLSWQQQALETGLKLHYSALQQTLSQPQNIDHLLKKEIDELGNLTYEEFKENHKLRKRLRKVLKSLGLLETVSSEKSSYEPTISNIQLELESNLELKETNNSEQLEGENKKEEEELNLLPLNEKFVYRLTEDQLQHLERLENFKMEGNAIPNYLKNGQEGTGITTDILWINAPIQDIPGDFRMCIPDTMTMTKDARSGETKVKILQYGTYQGKPVTKVSLMPVSGRRHQLRLHCLAMGHPIVGDGTYGSLTDDDQSERMMLHAHEIFIRLKYKKIDSLIEAKTEDPFPFNDNNELVIDRLS